MTSLGRIKPEPESGPRNADLRHDLLTPVNHIIGYGEMLEEEAEEAGRPELLAGVRAILRLGKEVSALINRVLPPAGGVCTPADYADLRYRLSILLGLIVENCELLRESAEDPADLTLSENLTRVRAAANRLAEIVERRLGSPAHDAGQPAA